MEKLIPATGGCQWGGFPTASSSLLWGKEIQGKRLTQLQQLTTPSNCVASILGLHGGKMLSCWRITPVWLDLQDFGRPRVVSWSLLAGDIRVPSSKAVIKGMLTFPSNIPYSAFYAVWCIWSSFTNAFFQERQQFHKLETSIKYTAKQRTFRIIAFSWHDSLQYFPLLLHMFFATYLVITEYSVIIYIKCFIFNMLSTLLCAMCNVFLESHLFLF